MVGFSDEAIEARRSKKSSKLRAVDVLQYARRQILAAVEHWASSDSESIEQLKFRLRTMKLVPPSGDTRRDDARILMIENGAGDDYEIRRRSKKR